MAGRSRLGPDPTVQVGDLQQKIWEVTQRQGCMDMAKLLHSSKDQKWKTAPDQEWLGGDGLADLLASLFSLHSNGVLQSTKLKKALLKLQSEKGRMNFTRLHDSDWCDKMDELIRIAAGQYRTAKQDPLKYSRLVKKCSIKEKKNIDTVLSFMVLAEEDVNTGGCGEGEPADCGEGGPAEKAIVAAEEAFEPAVDKSWVVAIPKPASSIFQRVLKRDASDPASPSFGRGKISRSNSSLEKNPGMPKAESLAALDLAEKEEEELLTWMQKPSTVEKKQQKKKKSKKDNGQKEEPAASGKKRVAKKPAVKQQKPAATHKSSFLHRATSTAYHKAKNAALKMKKSKEEALAAGREASNKVSKDIQAGLLKES